MDIQKIKAALVHLPHVQKVWCDEATGAFYLTAKKGCKEVDLNEKVEEKKVTKPSKIK